MNNKRKAILYSRFSSSQQADGDSITRQLQSALNFCKIHDLELSPETFSDLGISGWKSNVEREGLETLLRCVREGYIACDSVILVEDADRLSRQGFMHVLNLVTELVATGCTFVTLSNGQQYTRDNVTSLATALPLIISADLAQMESKKKSDRLRAVKTKKRLERVVQGNQPFWIDVIDGVPVLNDKLPIIRRIVDLSLAGYRPLHIARTLNSDGIPSPRGKTWHVAVIRSILRNTILYGAKSYHESRDGEYKAVERVKGLYPAVCTHAEFQMITVEKSTKVGIQEHGPFSQLLRCKCGAALVNKQKRGSDTYRVCSAYLQGTCHEKGYFKNIDDALLRIYSIVPTVNRVIDDSATELDLNRISELRDYLAELEDLREQYKGKPKMQARIFDDIDKAESELEGLELKLNSRVLDTQDSISILDLPKIEQNTILRRYLKTITCIKLNPNEIECTVETKSGKFCTIYISYTRGCKEPLVVSTFLDNDPHENRDKFSIYR